jgi:hypothetical protein
VGWKGAYRVVGPSRSACAAAFDVALIEHAVCGSGEEIQSPSLPLMEIGFLHCYHGGHVQS